MGKSRTYRVRALAALALTLIAAVALAACGGGSSSSSSSTTAGSGSQESSAGSGASTAGESSGSGIAAAEKILAPYEGEASPFPVEEPLKKRPPASTTVTYMQCSTPTCERLWPPLEEAAGVLGVHINRIKAGSTAQEVANAYDTAVAEEPDGVIVGVNEPQLFAKQLKELQEAGTAVAAIGLVSTEEYGIKGQQSGRGTLETVGELLAAKAVVEGGEEANVVFYVVPEISFTHVSQETFEKTLGELCPGCTARYVNIPVTSLGTKLPDEVVSDIQQNPETNVAVFSAGETGGLPAALKTAGITGLKTFGYSPSPLALEYVKNGEESAVLSLDIPTGMYTTIDEIARLVTGQPLSAAEETGKPPVPPIQFLNQKDITFDPSKGWLGYPEFKERFETLWSGKEWTGK